MHKLLIPKNGNNASGIGESTLHATISTRREILFIAAQPKHQYFRVGRFPQYRKVQGITWNQSTGSCWHCRCFCNNVVGDSKQATYCTYPSLVNSAFYLQRIPLLFLFAEYLIVNTKELEFMRLVSQQNSITESPPPQFASWCNNTHSSQTTALLCIYRRLAGVW